MAPIKQLWAAHNNNKANKQTIIKQEIHQPETLHPIYKLSGKSRLMGESAGGDNVRKLCDTLAKCGTI